MLTSERMNGIKTGFWSPTKKDELIQKLGPIERDGPRLLCETCDQFCHAQVNARECSACPLQILRGYIKNEDTFNHCPDGMGSVFIVTPGTGGASL